MDDRRNFLSKLLALGSLAAIPEVKVETPVADLMKYKGFELRWTGWKPVPNMDILVGQWVANKFYGACIIKSFYASYPGGQREYYPGQMFDTAVRFQEGTTKYTQEPVMAFTPEQKKEEFRLECLERLTKLIDENGREHPNL